MPLRIRTKADARSSPTKSTLGRHPRASTLPVGPAPTSVSGPIRTDGHVVAVVVTKRPWLAFKVGLKLARQTHQPVRVVVCTAFEGYDVSPIVALIPGVPVDLVVTPPRVLGELRNVAMDFAAAKSDDDTILCTVDDDDAYGADYFAGIVDCWRRHPDAVVVGRAIWQSVLLDEPPDGPPPPCGSVQTGPLPAVTGSTISIPRATWKGDPDLRYPAISVGEDVAFQEHARKRGQIYSAYFGDFMIVRCSSSRHEHASPNLQQAVPALPRPTGRIRPTRSRVVR